jgi:cathepsin D
MGKIDFFFKISIDKVLHLRTDFCFISGFANSSLYTGDIEYINMPVKGSYWILPLTCTSPFFCFALSSSFGRGFYHNFFLAINVQGNTINLPSGVSSYAAIDTGTTLVGGPPQYISEIFAQIPGSSPGTENFQSYYTYRAFLFIYIFSIFFFFLSLAPPRSASYAKLPGLFCFYLACNTTVSVQMSFGGKNWTIDPADFRLSKLSATQCLGAFFELATGSSAPSWIVGDTFLVRSNSPPPHHQAN